MVLVVTAEMAKEHLIKQLKLEINDEIQTKIQKTIFYYVYYQRIKR